MYFKVERQLSEIFCSFCAGHKVSEIINLAGMFCKTVNANKKRMDDGEGVNRRARGGRKTVVDRDTLRDAIRSSPRASMRQHPRRLGVGSATVRRALAKLGAKSRVIVERPLLTPAVRIKRLVRQDCSLRAANLFRLNRDYLLR